MSAWIVDRAHIDVLVQALAESERVTEVDPDELGRMLWRENLRAVSIRYPHDKDGTRPGPISFRDGDVDAYTYRRPSRPIGLPGVYKAIACYQYQCAEYEGWDEAQEQLWLTSLRNDLDARGITYNDEDPWGYTEADVHGETARTVIS